MGPLRLSAEGCAPPHAPKLIFGCNPLLKILATGLSLLLQITNGRLPHRQSITLPGKGHA